ncbi:MAG: terminase gpA endonuclease subunit [Bryobacteraceae bacterium]
MGWSLPRSQDASRVIAVKGADHGVAIIGLPTPVDITSAGKKARRAAKVWPVNVSALKSELYGWLKLDMPTVERGEPFPPGYCHFPQLGEEFFRQLTAEQLITRIVKGYRKSEWQKARERNEALDTRVYARAAASQFGMDRFQEQHWTELEKQMGITAQAPPQPQVASSTPQPARQDFNRNERSVDPFHRLDNKPRWFGDRKRWFDR